MRPRAVSTAIAASSLTLNMMSVAGSAAAEEGCAPGIGHKLPVLFVHGFNGSPDIWNGGMKRAVEKLSAVKVVESFNYAPYSLQWVTDPHIAPRLAKQVNCLAASSRREGGGGKVYIIVHSMGGLVVREAMRNAEVVRKTAEVVTIATPNEGSDVDQQAIALARDLCTASHILPPAGVLCGADLDSALSVFTALPALSAGSDELKKLPDWPRRVPVLAIAGNVVPTYDVLFKRIIGQPSNSDTIVSKRSALHGVRTNSLGGTADFVCQTQSPLVLPFVTHAPCAHAELPSNAGVQKRVVEEVRKYLDATAPPAALCPTRAQFQQLAVKLLESESPISSFDLTSPVVCQDNWATAEGLAHLQGGGETTGRMIIRYSGEHWKLIDIGSAYEGGDSPACASPPKIRAALGC